MGGIEQAYIAMLQKSFGNCDMAGLRDPVDVVCEELDNYPARGCESRTAHS